MRILVAQMTRMGDVIQTTPMIRALRQKHADAHVTAMVRRMGVSIARNNPDIDDIIVYDEDEMFLDLKSGDSDRFLRAYETADKYVRQLRDGAFDVAYNCTHSLTSAMLLKLSGIPRIVGAHLSDDWQFVLRGRGVTYFFTSVRNREYNDLNLCDLFRHFVDGAPPVKGPVFVVPDEGRQRATETLERNGIREADFVVCFQLGASDTYKRWPESHFAELARGLIADRNARIVLLGVEGEAPLGEVFEQHAPGIALHLFGKTSIEELAAILERADLLVTNDTGTMHLAAAVRCPTVLVSVGYVHFRETGPYGEGHCAVELRKETLVESDLMRGAADDRGAITPAQARCAVDLVLANRGAATVPVLDPSPQLEGVSLSFSRFAPDGSLEWYPVIRRPIAQKDVLRQAYRSMWLESLGGAANTEAERLSVARMLECFAHDVDASQWAKGLAEPFARMEDLATQGERVTECLLACLREHNLQQAKSLASQLTALDEQTRLFGEINPSCRTLVAISRFERDNLEGADALLLAETTLRIYHDLAERARMLQEKIWLVAEQWHALPNP